MRRRVSTHRMCFCVMSSYQRAEIPNHRIAVLKECELYKHVKVTAFSILLGYIVILMNAGASNANHSLGSDCTLVTNVSGGGGKTVTLSSIF